MQVVIFKIFLLLFVSNNIAICLSLALNYYVDYVYAKCSNHSLCFKNEKIESKMHCALYLMPAQHRVLRRT